MKKMYKFVIVLFIGIGIIACQFKEQKIVNNHASDSLTSSKKDTTQFNTPLLSGTYLCMDTVSEDSLRKDSLIRLQVKEYLPNKYYFIINCLNQDSTVNTCWSSGLSMDFVVQLKDNRFFMLQKESNQLSQIKIHQINPNILTLDIISQSIDEMNRSLRFRYVNDNVLGIANHDGNRYFYHTPIFNSDNIKIPLYQFPDENLTPQIFELDRRDVKVLTIIYNANDDNPSFALIYFKANNERAYLYDDFDNHLWIKVSDLYKYYKINKPK